MKLFIDLKWFFIQEKKAYISGTLLLLLVALLTLVPPKIIGKTVDAISSGNMSTKDIVVNISILAVTGTVMYGLRYYWRIMIFGSAVKLARQLRSKLFNHFTDMPQSFFQQRRIGDLMAHATNDLQAIQATAGSGVLTLVDSLATGGFVILAMFFIDWKLTLICLIPMPLMAFLTNYYGTLLHKRFHKAQEAFSNLNDKTQESISGIRVIKTFGHEYEDIQAFTKKSEEVVEKNIAVARVDSLFDPTISIIVGISFFLSIAFGSRLVLNNNLSIGELVSFSTYLGLLIWPMLAFGWLFNIVERGRASYDRVMNLLSVKPEIVDKHESLISVPTGAIYYQIDEFSYPGEKHPVLSEIHFTLQQGETLGIVGRTGAGKTTLMKLLTREFEGYKGSISYGSNEIKDYSLDSLRQSIGYVPQDHFLFSASIKENIAFSKSDSDINSIESAAMLSHIHDDIRNFPDGYETLVGERGVSLSGGQKQRISIARALLMDSEVLLLDDSLSAVDAKTERIILDHLKREREGKTTMITSHRLSAIKHANLILVLDQGKIIQRGSHEQLMAEEGWYKDMYTQQQLELLVEHGG
ncbi:ABC transporter transmembrane domain-containing protein [Peribacillus alkalitolerans]|uniref:ABC transporter transmembrane domain-containing protein n=1 Tax=Peribacillus alkalitolerans TaxID=1550385 RepID=UPI0013D091F7|nr:ABC transporter transmembrane domain-containing protein [Peribacillus alkalitolerans]